MLSMIYDFVRAYLKEQHIFVKFCFRLAGGTVLEIKVIQRGLTFMTSVEKLIPSTSKERKEVSSYIKSMLIFLTVAFVRLEFVPPDQPVNDVCDLMFL